MTVGKTAIGLTTFAIIIGFAVLVFACGSGNYGYGSGGGHMMSGGGHMMGGGTGNGAGGGHNHGDTGYYDEGADISQGQADAFKQSQAGRELRNEIEGKRFAINNELKKQNPDRSKIVSMQAQLSQMQAQYDQKAIEYQLESRRQFPQTDSGGSYGGHAH
jgi:Spy/CpxP family protein refolding chaperone